MKDQTAGIAQAAIAFMRNEEQRGTEKPGACTTLVYRPDAQPPFDKFLGLCDKEPKFKRAWDHRRQDFAEQSTANYDAALAGYAVLDGWTDQEIANLLIAHRQKYFEELRLGDSYYIDTIKGARAGNGPDATAPKDDHAQGEPTRVQQLILALNRALGIKIRRVTKYGANGGTYELELECGRRVDLGTTAAVLNHRQVKAAIADATAEVIPPFKQMQWDKIAKAIFTCAGPAPIEEAPEAQEMAWWIRSCVENTSVLDIDERDRYGLSAVLRDRAGSWAFLNQTGHLLIHLGGFLAAVHVRCGARPTWKECALRLRKLGFTPRDLEGKEDAEGKPRINVWQSPRGWLAGHGIAHSCSPLYRAENNFQTPAAGDAGEVGKTALI